MKILICSSYKYSAWNSVRPEAEMFIGFVVAGHQVTLCTQGDAEYVKRFKDNGVNVVDCYPTKKICFKTIKKIHRLLIEGDFDICYGFNSKSIPNLAFAAIGTRAKVIAYRGTTGGLYRHDPSAYLTQLHPRVDGIVGVSQAVTTDVKKRVWKNKNNVVTIYKGHQLDWYQVEATARSEFGLSDDDIVAVFAAHVRPTKGLNVLLDAIQHITNPKFHLILAGKGYQTYQKEIDASPLKERIHVIGQRSDVPSLMAMADLQVQPSISGEGLPRTVIEAMANKTPSVVTTTGGSPELIIHGESGYVVECNNSKAFAKAMNKLIDDKQLRNAMGKKAQQRLAVEFSSGETVRQHITFFDKLLIS
jgi:L-malate glycosyltransferase